MNDAVNPPGKLAYATPTTAPLVAGRRSFFKYRDLGVTAASSGKLRAQVTIGAEIKRETEAKDGEHVLRTERSYGSAYRSFTLPVDLDEEKSAARYENGVLELTLAKTPAVAGRKLTIL